MKKHEKKKKEPVVKDFEYYFHLTKGYILAIIIILAIAYANAQEQKQIKFTGVLNCSEITQLKGE